MYIITFNLFNFLSYMMYFYTEVKFQSIFMSLYSHIKLDAIFSFQKLDFFAIFWMVSEI